MKDYQLTINVSTLQHTYGDAVKGYVVFHTPSAVTINHLEMIFLGECGASFTSSSGNGACKDADNKILFTHRRTLVSGRRLSAGRHRAAFEFRFPKRHEVLLSPNTTSSGNDDFFWFNYRLDAKAVIRHENDTFLDVTSYPRLLNFYTTKQLNQRLSMEETTSTVNIEPRSVVGGMIKWKSPSRSEFSANLLIRKTISGGDTIPMSICVQPATPGTDATSNGTTHMAKEVQLESFELSLRNQVRLLAKGKHKDLNHDEKTPMRIGTFALSKKSEGPVAQLGQSMDVASQTNLKCPRYIRPTIHNGVVSFDYRLYAKAKLNINGRTYVAKFDNIPINILPPSVHTEDDVEDYASSPPEDLPMLDRDPYSPPVSTPSTPPPEWSALPDEEIEGRFRQNSSDHSYFDSFPCQS